LPTKAKIQTLAALYAMLPAEERIMVDVLRGFVAENIPDYCKEKISWQVPNFYGYKSIFIIWPASIKGGGFTEGVFFGCWRGCYLPNKNNFLKSGTNKRIFYRIFKHVDEIDFEGLLVIIKEVVALDKSYSKL
jgi:hypothetical protein